MLKKILLLLILILISVSCQDIEKSEMPENLIPEDKMIDVITETFLMQSARNFSKRIFESTGIKGKEYIYKKYDIDSVQFKHSNDYYADNYEVYQRIYDSVKNRFEKMKIDLDTLQKQELHVKDSIAQAKRDSIGAKDSLEPEKKRRVDKISDSLLKEADSLKIENDSLPEPVSRDQE